jgi:hypothetical protein
VENDFEAVRVKKLEKHGKEWTSLAESCRENCGSKRDFFFAIVVMIKYHTVYFRDAPINAKFLTENGICQDIIVKFYSINFIKINETSTELLFV